MEIEVPARGLFFWWVHDNEAWYRVACYVWTLLVLLLRHFFYSAALTYHVINYIYPKFLHQGTDHQINVLQQISSLFKTELVAVYSWRMKKTFISRTLVHQRQTKKKFPSFCLKNYFSAIEKIKYVNWKTWNISGFYFRKRLFFIFCSRLSTLIFSSGQLALR